MLTWLNVSIATLNAMSQLLVIIKWALWWRYVGNNFSFISILKIGRAHV